MTSTFTGADAAAAQAYIATADAVVRLQATAEELETHLEKCSEFAVGHAYSAFLMSLAGADTRAARRAGLARRSRGASPGVSVSSSRSCCSRWMATAGERPCWPPNTSTSSQTMPRR